MWNSLTTFLCRNSFEASSNIIITSPLLLALAAVFFPAPSGIIKAICPYEPKATAEQLKSGILVMTLKDLVSVKMPTAGKTIASA